MASKSVTRSLEMNSIFYDVLKLKKASKFKKYFDHEKTHRACTVSIPESSIQFLIILL